MDWILNRVQQFPAWIQQHQLACSVWALIVAITVLSSPTDEAMSLAPTYSTHISNFTSMKDLHGKVFNDFQKQKWRILSIDGGGVKGVIPAVILERLEGQLNYEVKQWLEECRVGADYAVHGGQGERFKVFLAQDKASNRPSGWEDANLMGRGDFVKLLEALELPDSFNSSSPSVSKYLRIPDFFDVLAGTSSGGLTAAFLATPDPQTGRLRHASEVKDLYISASRSIFSEGQRQLRSHWWSVILPLLYKGNALDQVLKTALGENTTLLETVKPCILPTFDLDLQAPTVWETGMPDDPKWKTKSTLLWQVCRATAAPPTYLLPAQIDIAPDYAGRGFKKPHQYVDGGLFANDPFYYAYRWAFANADVQLPRGGSMLEKDFFFHPKEITGFGNLALSLGTGFVTKLGRFASTRWWPPAWWAAYVVDAALKGSGQAVHYGMYYPFVASRSMPAYLRLNPSIEKKLDHLDSSKDIPGLSKKATDFLKEKGHRNEPNYLAKDPFGKDLTDSQMEQLKDLLTGSYVNPSEGSNNGYATLPTKQQQLVDEIFKENNGQTLARFAQLLVREWVFRVRLGARKSACYNAFHDKQSAWK